MQHKKKRVNSATPAHALLNELRLRALDLDEFKALAAEVTEGRFWNSRHKLIAQMLECNFVEITVCITPAGRDAAIAADKRMAQDFARVAIRKAASPGEETNA